MKSPLSHLAAGACALVLTVSPARAQETESKSPTGGALTPEMMAQMMQLAQPGENHKLLAQREGNWTYTVKMWLDPAAPPNESKGTSSTKAIMGGRFFLTEVSGKFEMPGPDGKMQEMNFTGMGMQGYDNVKKKFVTAWIDNMGTTIIYSEGDYDPATKTFTSHSEYEVIPGMKQKVREVVRIVDQDHHTMEWWENRSGQDVKTMEISYTRKK